ncbi:EI24 domain-containing protein [Rhodopila sp.]|uniref:EI24 domain-containing protein n=1 Tax=Rhodopila sp. TaxID=2480087 RepID=UPI003D09B03F
MVYIEHQDWTTRSIHMWSAKYGSPFSPLTRALGQLDDPIIVGVVARTVGWSIACFVGLYVVTIWFVHWLLGLHGVAAWATDIIGSIGASFLALWLFLPVAAAIGTMYFDTIAFAVERRFFPYLPPPRGAPAMEQLWDGLAVACRVLLFNFIALVLAMILPGAGLVLGWLIAAYAIGRGLFVAVAMRRMSRNMAESLYRSRRSIVLTSGAILAAASYVPLLNLLIPVVGTAAMVHVLDVAVAAAPIHSRSFS